MSGPTCSYCGQQIEPGHRYCPACGTEAPAPPVIPVEPTTATGPVPVPEPTPEPVEGITEPVRPAFWTERQWRIFELALVCAVAFAASVLRSTEVFFSQTPQAGFRSSGEMAWIYSMIRQGTALAVLWYVLRRRSKSFGNIGLRWNLKEVGFGLGLFVLAWIVAACSYSVVRLVVDPAVLARQPDVDRMLFGGHVASTAIVFAFLNPFFEELIVRAYVISEIKALTNRISVAVAVSVVLQTSYHFYQGAPAALMHSGTFLIFALYYAKTNRIGAPIVAHLLLDVWPIVSYMARLHQRSF